MTAEAMARGHARCSPIISLSDDNFHRPVLKSCDCNYIIWRETYFILLYFFFIFLSRFFFSLLQIQCFGNYCDSFSQASTWSSGPWVTMLFFLFQTGSSAADRCAFLSFYSQVKPEHVACSEYNIQIVVTGTLLWWVLNSLLPNSVEESVFNSE